MALQFSLSKRRDMRKDAPEGSKLYYGVTKASHRIDMNALCDSIADQSTASRGDVKLVIEGLIKILQTRLQEGCIVSLNEFGSFMVKSGSQGAATAEEFSTSLFKRPRIVFRPGILLRDIPAKVRFERAPMAKDPDQMTEIPPDPDQEI